MTRKTSYGLVQLLGFLLVQQALAANYNTAVFSTCNDSGCQATQADALMSLYDSTQVKKRQQQAANAGAPEPSVTICVPCFYLICAGCFMEHQHQLGFQYCPSLRMVWCAVLRTDWH